MKKQVAIIGNFDLVIECAKMLEELGFNIICLFSETYSVLSWAKNQHILSAKNLDSFFEIIQQKEIDYLFSIQNSFIIPDNILNSIHKLAINYHNTLLPQYAGIQNHAWTIWFNEKESGITWHVMNNLIAGGDILKQARFPLDKDETAFSLELKCQQYALRAFKELAIELSLETVSRKMQDLSKRSFFDTFSRPCGFAVIDWNNAAKNIDRQFRALNFGSYTNPISILKFRHNGKYFVVLEVILLEYKTSDTIPGTVINIKNGLLQVATKTNDILIGYKALNDYINAFEILRGEMLESEMPPLEQQIPLAEQIAHDEFYWKELLSQFFPGRNFTQNKSSNFDTYSQLFTMKFDDLLPPPLTHSLDDILTILLIYLYRVNNYEDFSLTIFGNAEHIPNASLHELFLEITPLNVNLNSELNFTEAKRNINELLRDNKSRSVCLRELLVRYPSFKAALERNTILLNISQTPFTQNNTHPIIINLNEEAQSMSLSVANSFLDKIPFFLHFMEIHLKNLVKNWVVLNMPLNKINFLSLYERQYLKSWNATHIDSSDTQSITSIIDRICEQFPNNIAIETKEQKISYLELKNYSDQIAKNLLYFLHGRTPTNNLVGIFLDKSAKTILTFLGVLKAGLTYVVLDIAYPDAYLENIIQSTQIEIFISQSSKHDRLGKIIYNIENYGTPVYLDLDKNLFQKNKKIELPKNIPTTTLAYILFTSGSTGKPKGVMIAQRSVINLINAVNASIGITHQDKLLQFSTLAFDTSVWEIYASFFAGGTLYVPDSSEILIGRSLQKTIISKNISFAIFPPSVLKIQPYFESASLKTIVVGGEECFPILPKQWGKYYKFINVYGPTESTVIATMSGELRPHNTVTIGRPIQNYQITICDRYQIELPIGAIGEIIISGLGVAQGYINNSELTQQKFKSVCVLGEEKIAYLSGDLGVWTKKGQIQYMGRIDAQLKIRGFRVEPIMIEQMINTYTGINTCIVLPQKTEKERLFLNAYILTEPLSTTIDVKNLKNFLKAKLPHFMIPKNFFLISALPLTTTGKIDHKKLLSGSWKNLGTFREEPSLIS